MIVRFHVTKAWERLARHDSVLLNRLMQEDQELEIKLDYVIKLPS